MNGALGMHALHVGAWVMETEEGGYYRLCKVGVWIEFHAPIAAGEVFGARWTIDGWDSHQDTPAFVKEFETAEFGLWRIEITNVITTGWRDGSIGGPHGEQPSADRWILWGKDKAGVRCLPLGSVPPRFEFALYRQHRGNIVWENDPGCNFTLCLNEVC